MEKHLTSREVAEQLGVTIGTLDNWRSQNRGPDYVKVEGAIRYPVSAIVAYLAERTVRSGDQS